MVGLNNSTLRSTYIRCEKSKKRYFYIGSFSLILSVFCVFSKSWPLLIIFSILFVASLLLYIYMDRILKKLFKVFKTNCPICNNKIKHIKETRYMLQNVIVSKNDYELSIEKDKKILEIDKYICIDCKFCYLEMTTYYFNNKGIKKVYKKQNNVDFNYSNAY